MEPEKKVKLEIEDVYVFQINHWEDCGNSPECSCLSLAENRFEKGWNIPEKTEKDGFKFKDYRRIALALSRVVSSLPSWHLRVSQCETTDFDGTGEYRIRKFTGVRQSLLECFNLFVDPDSESFAREASFYILDQGWTPLTEKTSSDPLELSNDEELDEWIEETKHLVS